MHHSRVNIFSGVFMCIMSGILICIGSDYIAISIPGTVLVLYFMQKFYLRTSRQMRLLDLEYKSPLYQQFTETLEGLETIRGFGWQDHFNQAQLERLDVSQRPFYLLYMIQRWLNLGLDMLVCSLAILLVGLALCVPSSSSGEAIGVALSSVLSFNTSLKMLIMSWTGAETSLGSVARTQTFEKFTPSEDDDADFDPGNEWPKGRVTVENMSLKYGDGTEALKNVSFTIEPGQKFGVCGRTGR
jgi:ATP-binding cassette subfamily C (CFTR/MRP) protein 1